MSKNWLVLLELLLVFGVVIGFCLQQIYSLKRDRLERERQQDQDSNKPPKADSEDT